MTKPLEKPEGWVGAWIEPTREILAGRDALFKASVARIRAKRVCSVLSEEEYRVADYLSILAIQKANLKGRI